MKIKLVTTLALFCALISSCASKKEAVKAASETPVVSTNKISNLPAWVLDPAVKDGVAAVGIAGPSKGGIRYQIPKAEMDAKANIAATIQSEISRVTKDALREGNTNGVNDVEEFFAQATKEVVKDLPLSGVRRINIHQADDGTLYVHMVLKSEDYSKFLTDSRNSFSNQLKQAAVGRDNIKKAEEATKSIFDELEKERDTKEKMVESSKPDAAKASSSSSNANDSKKSEDNKSQDSSSN